MNKYAKSRKPYLQTVATNIMVMKGRLGFFDVFWKFVSAPNC